VTGAPAIAVLDYGMGNLRSVEKALERGGARVSVTNDEAEVRAADGLVLPGVGAFPKAVANLRARGLDELLEELVPAGVPTLGICLGLQLLFESSTENGGARGLGFLKGSVKRLPAPGLKVPLIGWSEVIWSRPSPLTDGLPARCPFYFVHSYAPAGVEDGARLGTAEYGQRFVCAVARGPLFGVQFHPEKSSRDGLQLLRNFVNVAVPA
jgi:imidazole glycerol-phosphate synthase subunit HisH